MARPLSDDWRDWLRLNRDRGCDRAVLYRRAADEGFDPMAIALELGTPELALLPRGVVAAADAGFWQAMAQAPLTNPDHRPRAWRLDTDRAQIYEIPDLLSPDECTAVMAAIDAALVPSTVTLGPSDYRTSRTCHLASADAALTRALDVRFAALVGVDPALAEPLQGQRYDPGQYFKAHTDWFAPDTYWRRKANPAFQPTEADSHDPNEPGVPKRVQRGGSFLCSDLYCIRYRLGSRGKGEPVSAACHIGFRCAKSAR